MTRKADLIFNEACKFDFGFGNLPVETCAFKVLNSVWLNLGLQADILFVKNNRLRLFFTLL